MRVPLTHLLFSSYSYKDTCYVAHFTEDFTGRTVFIEKKNNLNLSFKVCLAEKKVPSSNQTEPAVSADALSSNGVKLNEPNLICRVLGALTIRPKIPG